MAKCYIEMEGSPPELLYEDVRDGRGNFIETTYHNRTCVKNIWEQMAKNIARTVRECLIQQPELIPVFAELIEANKEEFPESMFDERTEKTL